MTRAKGVAAVILDLVLVLLVVLFSLFSPYRYEWDEGVRQIDCAFQTV